MDKPPELTPLGQVVQALGILLGIGAAAAVIFLVPVQGMIPGALTGMAGGVVGLLIGRPLALALSKRKQE